MAGPSKQFDRDAALDRAVQLFWEQGFEATSMQDLVTAMGVNRASLYQTYGNKQSLYLASLERYAAQILAHLGGLLDQPGTPLSNLRDLFVHVIGQSLEGKLQGCFINNTAVELGPHDADLANHIRTIWVQFETLFARQLQKAIDRKELPADADPHQLARLLNINLQGLVVKTKANSDKGELMAAIDALFELIRK